MFINGLPIADGFTHGKHIVQYETTAICENGKEITLYPAKWQDTKEVIIDAIKWLNQYIHPRNIIVKH